MFLLIATTQGNREKEFRRFVNSLNKQGNAKFELIVVNQGRKQSTHLILNDAMFKYNVIDTEFMSLSKARNIGLSNGHNHCEFVAFPDDDCWYSDGLLERIEDILNNSYDVDGISCCVYDPYKERSLYSGTRKRESIVSEYNFTKYTISVSIFCRNIGLKFDENFGVGAKWGSGEESDYILRFLQNGMKMIYFNDLKVYHPYPDAINESMVNKMYSYCQGQGALIMKMYTRKQRGTLNMLLSLIIRSICGMIFYFLTGNLKYKMYLARLRGIFNGMMSYHQVLMS